MTSSQLEELLKEILRSYWRQRVSLKLFKSSFVEFSSIKEIEYLGVPEVGIATAYLSKEATEIALNSLEENLKNRVPKDLFMAQIANFESFMSQALAALGVPATGTFGALQRAIETQLTIPVSSIEKLDEIRERRNVLIHNHGNIDVRYASAASKVVSSWVQDPASLRIITVEPEYLSYVVDVLVEYSNHV